MSIPRIDVDRRDIADVVTAFYQRVRLDETLGPVFAEKIHDWSKHEVKIINFWANALLLERAYSGNPMRAHMDASNVMPAHFKGWLRIFDEVLKEQIKSPQCEQWSALAHRIGRGLCLGLSEIPLPPEHLR